MTNIENTIKNHISKKIENPPNQNGKLNHVIVEIKKYPIKGGNWRKENIIYHAEIRTENENKIYIGLS